MVVVFKILVGVISYAAINNWNSEAQIPALGVQGLEMS